MAGWFDSHVHLDFWRIEEVPGVIRAAEEAGVERILTVGRGVISSAANVWIAHRFDSVLTAVGIHPLWPDPLDDEAYRELKALTADEKVVAIGEVGIGVGRSPETRDAQREKLARSIQLGRETGLPIIMHNDRESGADIAEIFEREKGMEVGGVMHSTMIDIDSARPLWEMGVFISIGRQIIREEFQYLEEVVRQVPEDRLIIETDSAGGGNLPHHRSDNTPDKLMEVAERVASLRNTSLNQVRETTVSNINKLLRL